MDTNDVNNTNQREHFRIDDDVELTYVILEDNVATASVGVNDSRLFADQLAQQHFKLMYALSNHDSSSTTTLHAINRENPEVATYLKTLDDKLTTIAHHLYMADNRPTQRANLSMGGIRFNTAEPLAAGTRLRLKLVLSPSLQGILCSGIVVDSKETTDNENLCAVKFMDLTEADEQILGKHITFHQTRNLQQQHRSLNT